MLLHLQEGGGSREIEATADARELPLEMAWSQVRKTPTTETRPTVGTPEVRASQEGQQ